MTSSKKDTSNTGKYMYPHRRNKLYQHQYNNHYKLLTRRNQRNLNAKHVQNARNWNMTMYSGLWNVKTPMMPADVKEDPTLKKKRHSHCLQLTLTHHPY